MPTSSRQQFTVEVSTNGGDVDSFSDVNNVESVNIDLNNN